MPEAASIAAVDEDRADQRLADVGQDGGAVAAAGIVLRSAEPDRGAEIDRARHVRAGLLAHEIGEPARHFAFVGLREGANSMSDTTRPEHMVAEEFEPLIAAGAVARTGERGDVGERLFEQRRVLEAVADALLEARGARGAGVWAPWPPASWRRLARGGSASDSGRPGSVGSRPAIRPPLCFSVCGSSKDRE